MSITDSSSIKISSFKNSWIDAPNMSIDVLKSPVISALQKWIFFDYARLFLQKFFQFVQQTNKTAHHYVYLQKRFLFDWNEPNE